MLPRRLSAALAALGAVVALGACDQPIRENVVEPGVTAIQQARVEACELNASTLRSAIEIYEIRNGEPPPDEAALVPDYIREETADWDVVDGRLVAENPACGPVGGNAPTPTQVDIVTEPGEFEARTAEEYLADLTPAQIEGLGGPACAAELADIFAAVDRYVVEVADVPASLADVVDAGLLDPPQLWQVADDELVPVTGSGCEALTAP